MRLRLLLAPVLVYCKVWAALLHKGFNNEVKTQNECMAPKMSTSRGIHLEKNKIPWHCATSHQGAGTLYLPCVRGSKGVGNSSVHCFVTMSDLFVLQATDLAKSQQHNSGQRHQLGP